MAIDKRSAGGLAWLPPIWLVIVMGLSIYGIWVSWPLLWEYGLPDSVYYLIYAEIAVGVMTVVWGAWLLALAFSRSPAFPRQFIVWQAAVIVCLVASHIYILAIPEFVFDLRAIVQTLAEVAIGIGCIAILRYPDQGASLVYTAPVDVRPPAYVSVIGAIIGLLVGGAVGFGAGLFGGAVIAELTDVSCFEGACGYFAFFVGLGVMLVGAVAGAVFAVWWINRRRARLA